MTKTDAIRPVSLAFSSMWKLKNYPESKIMSKRYFKWLVGVGCIYVITACSPNIKLNSVNLYKNVDDEKF